MALAYTIETAPFSTIFHNMVGLGRLPVYQLFEQTRSEKHPVPVKHGIGYGRNPRVQIRENAQGFFSETLFGLWTHFPLAAGTRFFGRQPR